MRACLSPRDQVYYIPVHLTFQGVLTQLRVRPGVEAEAVVGGRNASLAPRRGDAFEIDWVSLWKTNKIS